MIHVIGLGNFLRGDDAVGPLVIERLFKSGSVSGLNLVNAGADPLTVLDYLSSADPVIIIDCAKMGRKPGEVVEFNINEANITQVQNTLSLHGIGFADIYKMAVALGTPSPCKIIAVEPKDTGFDSHLSPEVEASIPEIIKLVMMETQHYAKENFNN